MINPVLDAKQHVCARRDKSNLESRFVNIIKGYGVFATTLIEEGSFIVEYRGVLRDASECRPDAYSYYFIYNNTHYCIDASADDGSLGRLVNDDGHPNAKVKVVCINRIPHLCLFALRDIQAGEEISYDYGGYDLPWRSGTWLSMGKPTQFKNNEEDACEEPAPESDTTEQTGQQEQEACTREAASQTEKEACEKEVPERADKATQTTEENTSVKEIIWKYIPYLCLTSEHQELLENQLVQIQLTPVTQQLPSDKEKSQPLCSDYAPAVNEQSVNDFELNTLRSKEEPVEFPLTKQMTDEILEQQQTPVDVKPCVVELSTAQIVTDVELKSLISTEEASKCQPTTTMTDEVREPEEGNKGAKQPAIHVGEGKNDEMREIKTKKEEEQQILLQQQTSMDAEPCVNEESGPMSTAESKCEEVQLTGQDEACQAQAVETQERCNNDSYQSPTATTQSSDAESDSDSADEMSSSEEYKPDSESESDDDSDTEKPEKAKTTVASKQIEEQAKPPASNHLVTQATNLNFCFVCGKACTKIARHFKLHIKDNVEIATAFKLRKNSRKRSHLLEVLRNRGNYQHNNVVLMNGAGLIKARRMPKNDFDAKNFEYCMYCKGLYARLVLWKHVRRCTSNPDRDTLKTSGSVLGPAVLSQYPHLQHLSKDVHKMLCDMHQDEVAQVVRNDEYVLRLAQDFYDKRKGNSKERHSFVRQTVRCIGKLLLLLQNKFAIRNLAEAIKPSNFSMVIEAVKELAEYNQVTKRYAIPSLARRIGLTLRKYCVLSAQKAFEVGDKILIQAAQTFTELFNNAQSAFALGEKICLGKPFLLPFVNDVRLFHCHLEKAAQCAMRELRETPSAQSYADLCKVTLAQILMFNRRHGEVSQMTIKSFQERDQAQPPEISEALTELEKVFCKEYCKLMVRQKVRAFVPIILTPAMIHALTLLMETRERCGVLKSNIYVFGQPKSNKCYRGENALQLCASECGAMNPDDMTSIKFSKHISTLTQFLTLKNHELKQLAKFIGHDISLQKDYYRRSEAGPRLAKICKLLLAIEKGRAAEMIGQSLDDVKLPEVISESDSEDEYFEDDKAFLKHHRLRLALHVLYKPKSLKTNYGVSAPKRKKLDNESASKRHENKSTCMKQENESTAKEQEIQPQVKRAKEEGLPHQEQTEQQLEIHNRKVRWTKDEKGAIMKHFTRHIYYGRLATVKESVRCKMLEHPVLNNRTIQNIRDFVRNTGRSLKRKAAAENSLSDIVAFPTQTPSLNSTSVRSTASADTSTSNEPSSQTANRSSSISAVTSSPATGLMKPILLFSQNPNYTTTTTLPPQVTLSTNPNAPHPQAKHIYITVKAPDLANQASTASLPLQSQAANPNIIRAVVNLPVPANPCISNANALQIPHVANLTNSSILIPQDPKHTLPQAASAMCAGVLVPQSVNPTSCNVQILPAEQPGSSTMTPPQITVLGKLATQAANVLNSGAQNNTSTTMQP